MFYYLASPYTRFPGGIQAAFEEAARQTALLVRAGVPVYSPIAHTHSVAIHGQIDPLDHSIWMEADRTFMQAARGLIVCRMTGWETSYGVGLEIDVFQKMGKPIIGMEPGTVPPEVLPKQRKVLGLCGYAGVGKDEAAKGLAKEGWTRVGFADALRESLLALDPLLTDGIYVGHHLSTTVNLWGWDEAKKRDDVRRLLQRLGTEAGRDIHGWDCWVNIARRKIDAAPGNVVLTDVRFPNEVALVREMRGTVIRIERPGVGPKNDHVSERLDFDVDRTITNDGDAAYLHRVILAIAAE